MPVQLLEEAGSGIVLLAQVEEAAGPWSCRTPFATRIDAEARRSRAIGRTNATR
jgi:hypothetical protein